MPKKTEKLEARLSYELKEQFSETVCDLDLTPSQLVRVCLLLALPQIRANPALSQVENLSKTYHKNED